MQLLFTAFSPTNDFLDKSLDTNLPNDLSITRFARFIHRFGNVQAGDREQAEIHEKQQNTIENSINNVLEYITLIPKIIIITHQYKTLNSLKSC